MRDRLRAVECPSDMIDQIGGWATEGVGHSYGTGYELDVSAKWMRLVPQKQSGQHSLHPNVRET